MGRYFAGAPGSMPRFFWRRTYPSANARRASVARLVLRLSGLAVILVGVVFPLGYLLHKHRKIMLTRSVPSPPPE